MDDKNKFPVIGSGVAGAIIGATVGLTTAHRFPHDLFNKTAEELATEWVAEAPDAEKLTPEEAAVRVAVEKAKAERSLSTLDAEISSLNRISSLKGLGAGAGLGAALGAGGAAALALRRRKRADDEEPSPERSR